MVVSPFLVGKPMVVGYHHSGKPPYRSFFSSWHFWHFIKWSCHYYCLPKEIQADASQDFLERRRKPCICTRQSAGQRVKRPTTKLVSALLLRLDRSMECGVFVSMNGDSWPRWQIALMDWHSWLADMLMRLIYETLWAASVCWTSHELLQPSFPKTEMLWNKADETTMIQDLETSSHFHAWWANMLCGDSPSQLESLRQTTSSCVRDLQWPSSSGLASLIPRTRLMRLIAWSKGMFGVEDQRTCCESLRSLDQTRVDTIPANIDWTGKTSMNAALVLSHAPKYTWFFFFCTFPFSRLWLLS